MPQRRQESPRGWPKGCLTNRSQTVCIGDISSTPSICIYGVPQGSVLGPVLFSLYISPLVKLFRVLVFYISNMSMMRNSTSASKLVVSVLQLTAEKHAYLLSVHGFASMVSVSILTSQNPYSLARTSICKPHLQCHLSEFQALNSNSLIT